MVLVVRLFLVLCSKKCMLGKSWRLHFLLHKTMKAKLANLTAFLKILSRDTFWVTT